jgi:hypothetical protein
MDLPVNASYVFAGLLFVLSYALGRNVILWTLLGWVLQPFALFFFLYYATKRPKVGPAWVSDLALRFKTWLWSRKMKPGDFDDRR